MIGARLGFLLSSTAHSLSIMRGLLVIAFLASGRHALATPSGLKEKSLASMLLATQPSHSNLNLHKRVRASLAGMWDPEEAAAAYQAFLQSSDSRSSARPAESPRAAVPAPEEFEEYEDFGKRAWQAAREGDHAEVAKLEWLAKKAGSVWSKEKKEAPLSLDSFPASASKPKASNRYVDEFAQAVQKAKLEGKYDEVAKQEWLAKRAGKVWSKQKKEVSPSMDSLAVPARKTQTTFQHVVDEFVQAAQKAKLEGKYDEVAKQEWLAKRAGSVWSNEKQKSPTFKPDLGSAPAPKKFQYQANEFAQAAHKAMLEGKYDEALKQDWMAERSGRVWSNEKQKSQFFKPDLGSASAPKKFQYQANEFAQAANKAMLEGKYDEAMKQDWMAERSGRVWSNEKQKSEFFKPDLGPAPATKKPNLFVDETAKQAWEAKRAGDYAEVAKQEWLAQRAGSRAK
jgi:hypothetical protein